MIASITGGSGFGGCVGYCMGGGGEQKKAAPDVAAEKQAPADPAGKRVLWSETRNLATNDPRRAARMMEATARDAAMLKKLAGIPAAGRKLRKPVTHYSLNWAQDEKPTRAEMRQAAEASLKRLGLSAHQAVLVAHGDTKHPHLHVIVNRVNPENGRAANLWQSKATLSKWALQYEQQRGKIRCPARAGNVIRRERNKLRRGAGRAVVERVRGTSQGKGRYHRAKPRIRRQTKAADRDRFEQVAWWRAEERKRYHQALRSRAVPEHHLERRQREDWHGIYQRHRGEAQAQAQACRTFRGRLRTYRAHGKGLEDAAAVMTGNAAALDRWRRSLEVRQRMERVMLAQQHRRQFRDVDEQLEKSYRRGLEGAEGRAETAARTGRHPDRWLNIHRERIEQTRELWGGPTYEEVAGREAAAEKARDAAWKAQAPERSRARERERTRGRDAGPSR